MSFKDEMKALAYKNINVNKIIEDTRLKPLDMKYYEDYATYIIDIIKEKLKERVESRLISYKKGFLGKKTDFQYCVEYYIYLNIENEEKLRKAHIATEGFYLYEECITSYDDPLDHDQLTLSTWYLEDIVEALSCLIDKAEEEGFDKFEVYDTSQSPGRYRTFTYDYIEKHVIVRLKNRLKENRKKWKKEQAGCMLMIRASISCTEDGEIK